MSTQTHRIFVKAPQEEIWKAITDAGTVARYGYGGHLELDPEPGTPWRTRATEQMQQFGMPEVVVSGEVLEADAPNRLVQTWQAHFSPELEAEPVGTVTTELRAANSRMFPGGGVTELIVRHELAEAAQQTAGIVGGEVADAGGGWAFILSDLKSLLETGSTLSGQ